MNDFSERPQTKKGTLGEQIVDRYLMQLGRIPYRPVMDAAHPFDRLAASLDKRTIFICETNSKPQREHWPDTGIDMRSYKTYCYMRFMYNLDTYLAFVDEKFGGIYGQFLSLLDRPRQVDVPRKGLYWYPRTEHSRDGRAEIRYFPVSAMETIGKLDRADIDSLKSLSTRNPIYDADEQPDFFRSSR